MATPRSIVPPTSTGGNTMMSGASAFRRMSNGGLELFRLPDRWQRIQRHEVPEGAARAADVNVELATAPPRVCSRKEIRRVAASRWNPRRQDVVAAALSARSPALHRSLPSRENYHGLSRQDQSG